MIDRAPELPPRLLVIDDDLVQRTIIGKIGQTAKYDCELAASYDEALRKLGEQRFDCVVLDLSLGERSGSQLLRAISEAGKPTVIIVSGCEDRVLNSAVRLANLLELPSYQIPKPLDLTEMRRALEVNRRRKGDAAPGVDLKAVVEPIDVNDAIERGALAAWYRPRVDLHTGEIVGCEAVPRVPHPRLGFIDPRSFVKGDEGLGVRLSAAMLMTAAREMSGIVSDRPGFKVAADASALLLDPHPLDARIDDVLLKTGLRAGALTLDVTESATLADVTRSIEALVALRVKGLSVGVAEFGRGQSSLTALAKMPFSEMQISNVFVQNCEYDVDLARVVKACASLGRQMSMTVVADGVDTDAQATLMREFGCDIAQGEFVAPPMDARSFSAWVEIGSGPRESTTLNSYLRSPRNRRRIA